MFQENRKSIESMKVAGGQHRKERDYWLNKLSGEWVKGSFPTDFERQENDISESKTPIAVEFEISGDLFQSLMRLSNGSDSRLHMILVTGLLLLLHKYSGHKDIIIGLPIYRQDIEVELINTMVALRNRLEENLTVKQLLLQVRESIGEAIENYSYPIELLPEQLNLPYPGKDFPLFDVVILLENIHDKTYLQHIKTKMIFYFTNTGIKITGGVEYNPGFYQEASIERIVGNLKQVLNTSLLNVDVQIKDLDILSKKEKRQLLMDFNDNKADFPDDKTIYHFMEKHAERNPHHIAIAYEGNEYTYRQLNIRTNRLAHILRSSGIKTDEPVGILLERSPLMIESILTIWKAGGAYLPIEPGYPGERIDHMLSDSKAKVLVTTSSLAKEVEKLRSLEVKKDFQTIFIDSYEFSNSSSSHLLNFSTSSHMSPVPSGAKPPPQALNWSEGHHIHHSSFITHHSKNLAYIIYTSGSTGKPKGAMVEHIGMMNHIQAKINDLRITANSIVIQNAPHTFDISVWQFFTAFIVGGKTIIYPDDLIMEPDRFLFRLIRDRVTILEVVPSYLAILLETLENQPGLINSQTAYLPLNYLLVTGEEIKPALIEKWFEKYPGIKMVNAYGPTEASDDITHYIMDKAPVLEQIPIGKPLQNFNIYILDDHMHLCPIGVKGEIWVSGIGVGRGYLNNPELTSDKFKIKNGSGALRAHLNAFGTANTHHSPLTTHYKFYKTGDLGYWRPDGTIEFFGRKDYQVKIRGFRIELGEIETQILKFTGVKDVVVIDRDNISGEKYLCAYIVLEKKINMSLLREYLGEKLPDYMIPSNFVTLDKLPLTHNGKIDRKALPEPSLGFKSMIYISEEKLNRFEESPAEEKKDLDESFQTVETQNLLDHQEREQVLFTFNETASDYPEDKMIGQLFGEQVEKTPDNTALEFEEKQLTYNLLNQRVNRLANLLRIGSTGHSPIMGIMVDPSLEMMIGILAIVKATGVFMPMDPEAPGERQSFVMEDTRAEVLLTTGNVKMGIYSYPYKRINLDDEQSYKGDDSNPRVLNIPTAPTHLLYTSGTTGVPKGVILENRSVVNLMKSVADMINFSGDDRVLSVTPITFDVFTAETILPLTKGSKVVIGLREAVIDYRITASIIEKKDITIYQSTPSILQRLISDPETARSLRNLRYLLTAGEPLMESLLEQLKYNTSGAVYNLYGPTETTLYSTGCDLTHENHVTIGKSLSNTRVYILDKNERVMPIGNVGELCIGGIGCARGYLNRPELTNEKFVVNPFLENDRIYKTGDLAKWLPDGNIEYVGRIDHQVKLGGIRIEPGEIENCLLTYGSIKEAAVVVKQNENEEKYLCAYLVSEKRIDEDELRVWLPGKLPHYMIPAIFVQLEKMPLTPNRKISRKLLTNLEIEIDTRSHYLAPGNAIEEKMVEIWSTVLNIPKETIGVTANFFEMGGHSLRAITIIAKIHKAFNVKVPLIEMFKTPSIRGIAGYIQKAKKDRYASIEPVEKKEYYAMSSTQKRLYILQQMELASTAYNMPQTIPLQGEPGIKQLEETFIRLINHHESFRTSFHVVNDEPVQKVHDTVEFKIEYFELANSQNQVYIETGKNRGGSSDLYAVTGDWLTTYYHKAFDLSRAPLLKVGIVMTGEAKYILVIVMHHIICDWFSHDILEKDFTAIYEHKELPLLRLQYKDFSAWQNSEKEKVNIKHQESYWVKEFSVEFPVLNLPIDYPRPIMQSFEGSTVSFVLTETETQTLMNTAKQVGATLFMSILAVYTILLAKLSGDEDIIVGIPILARRHVDLYKIMGMFTNTVAMRNYPSSEKIFEDFLLEVKQRTLEAFENQEYQFEDLVEKVAVRRDTSRNPIFDVMLNLLNPADYKNQSSRISQEHLYIHRKGTSKFDLNLMAVGLGDRISCTFEYCTRLFKPGTIDRIIGYFKKIISQLAGSKAIRLAEIEIITEKEKEEILYMSTGVKEIPGADITIHHLFEKKVELVPHRTALVFGNKHLSYAELNRRANQLAGALGERGVKKGTSVGLMAERSFEMIIGILGVMKVGSAYLPIDVEYPGARKEYMVKDSGLKLLLTNFERGEETGLFPDDIEIIDLRDNRLYDGNKNDPVSSLDGSDLVYVIYTSGSTGNPKGVMLEHRNLVNLLTYQFKYTNIDCSRVLQFATISFDASFHEIFSALLSGGKLYLINREMISNILGLFKYVEENDIKTLFLPMSFLRMVFNEDEFISIFPRSVTHIQTAGEQVIINDKLRRYLKEKHVYLHNHYGPSETHVVTTLTIDPARDIPGLPSIGKSVMNTNIYILDKGMNLVPVRVAGELYIGGIQVGRGYLRRDQLTQERFIVSPFVKGERLYKTGDLSRWLEEGSIEFLGRIDQQVKIRGFRVELEEVETHLLNHDDIREAVVSALSYETGEKYLCAYIVSEGTLEIAGLREYLGKFLPDYMIPSYFVSLEKIPLNPNAKIDRKALPLPGLKAGEEYTAPRDEIEEKMVTLWSDVLGVEREVIGIDKNFFQLGGQSLKSTVLVARMHKVFNVKVPLAEIFKTPTVRKISQYIGAAKQERYASIESLEKKEYYALSSAQKRLYILQQLELTSPAYNMPQVISLPDEPDIKKLEETFIQLINRHESLSTSFHMVNDEPVQKIHDTVEFKIKYYDMKEVEAKVEEDRHSLLEGTRGLAPLPKESAAALISSFIRPFDLSKAPLLTVGIIKTLEGGHILVAVMHHIISDGVSLEILTKDFMALYTGKVLPPLRLQYKDFSEWQNKEKQKEYIKQQEKYWLRQFEDKIPGLDLPTDYPRPNLQLFKGSALYDEVSCDIDTLRAIALENKATTFILLLTIFNIFLSKITGQEDIVVGTPVAGRRHADLEGIMGLFINSLALRNKPRVEKTFMEFLKEVRDRTLDAFENQDYQFEDLVEKLAVDRDRHNPIFDVFFTLQDQGPGIANRTGITAEKTEAPTENHSQNSPPDRSPHESEPGTSKFDLYLNIFIGEKLRLTFEYSTELFCKETIETFARGFKEIVLSVLKDKNLKLADIRMTTGILDSDLSGVTQELTALEF
jgi:amino acid adenylation domain-containing protein